MKEKSNIINIFSHLICTNINKCFITTILIFSIVITSCVTPSNIRNRKVYGFNNSKNKTIKSKRTTKNNSIKKTNNEIENNSEIYEYQQLLLEAKKKERLEKRRQEELSKKILDKQITNTDNEIKLASLDKQINEFKLNQNLVANKVNSIENDLTDIKYSLKEIKNAINQLKTPQSSAITGIEQKSDKKQAPNTKTEKSHKVIIKSDEDIIQDGLQPQSDGSTIDNQDKQNNYENINKNNTNNHIAETLDPNIKNNDDIYKDVSLNPDYKEITKLEPKEQKTLDEAIENAKGKNFHKAIIKLLILENKKLDKISKSNVKFWLGESHYGLKQYKKAIKYFLAVLQSGNNEIQDDSKLKIANAFIKSGKPEDAKAYYKKILTEHPNSEYVPKAMKMLQQL